MTERWTADGLPVFAAHERAGLRDFHDVYADEQDAIFARLAEVTAGIPALAALSRGTPGNPKERLARSAALLRQSLDADDWRPWVEQQRQQGTAFANSGVPFRDWCDLIGSFKQVVTPALQRRYGGEPARQTGALLAMARFVDASLSVIGDAYLATQQTRIEQQQQAIAALSTPVLLLRPRLLLVPLIGNLDDQRARQVTEQLLRAIHAHRARVVVVDVTGVATVDSRVAHHLLQTVEAVRLMGARVIVSGLSPDVATTLVTLGVDLSRLDSVADLQSGLEEAERRLGLRTVSRRRFDEEDAVGRIDDIDAVDRSDRHPERRRGG